MGIGNMINRLLKKSDDTHSGDGDEITNRGLTDRPETEDIYIKQDLEVPESEPSGIESGPDASTGHDASPGDGDNAGNDTGTSVAESAPEVTEEKVLLALSEVYDPEIPIDIVNLGLIYGVEINGGNVLIRMTMTAPGCPASGQIASESKMLVEELTGVDNVDIDIVWDPPWDPSRMSEEAQQSMGMI